eukprot:2971981-Pyramimonas_sp.AAC.1
MACKVKVRGRSAGGVPVSPTEYTGGKGLACRGCGGGLGGLAGGGRGSGVDDFVFLVFLIGLRDP